jgi:alpha-N-arabinofuranosidase
VRIALITVIALFAATSHSAWGQERLVVRPSEKLNRIDVKLYGHFLEHIFNSIVGGLWGQLIAGPSFEEPSATLGHGWERVKGDWALEDGELFAWAAVDSHALVGDPAWRDGVFKLRAKKEAGPEGFLVIFRAVDQDNFYWWNLGGWGNAHSAVEIESGGQRTPLPQTQTAATIETGRWYDIEIRMRGDRIEGYLDGNKEFSFQDDAYGRGRAGVGVWATQARYADIQFVGHEGETLYEVPTGEPARGVSRMWQPTTEEDTLRLDWTRDNPLNTAYCQRIANDRGVEGITQRGLSFREGLQYAGSLWLRGQGPVRVRVEVAGGLEHESRFEVDHPDWRPYEYRLTAPATTPDGVISILVEEGGEVWADQCSLSAEDTPYRPAIYDKVEAIQPAFIRWPGGCYAEYYRWQDGVGPKHARVTKPNYVWGGLDPNYFGTAEFIQLCRDVGAEPIIVLNIGHHAPAEEVHDYVQEALDWLEYCNGDASTPYGALRSEHGYPEPFNVTHWEIGNETWPMGVEAYAERAKLFVNALRTKQADLKILLCGSGGHNLEWNERLLERAANHMDYISTHHYMQGSFEAEMENGAAYPEFLHETAELVAASDNPKIEVACTEWNQQSIALRTGLYAGRVLNGFERYGDEVTMSCPALFIRRTDATDWNNAFINHNGHDAFVAPNYIVMKLYRDHFAPQRVAAEGPEGLDVIATLEESTGDVIVKVVNPSRTEEAVARLQIEGREEDRFKLYRVWSPGIDDENSMEYPNRIQVEESDTGPEVVFPAHSVTVIRTR